MGHLIDAPIAGMQEPVFLTESVKFIDWAMRAIPACVHPEIFKSYFFTRDLIDKAQTRGCLHPAPSQVRNGQNNWFPVVLGGVIFQDVAAQNIMGIDIIAVPRQEQDFRSANLLAGMQRDMGRSHASRDRDRPFGCTRKADGPGSRPSQGTNQTMSSGLNIEERNHLNCFAATFA